MTHFNMILFSFLIFQQDIPTDIPSVPTSGALVIPIQLNHTELAPQTEAWVEISYLGHPGGKPLFQEFGEKVWWVQEQAFLVLGATGLPLPREVTARASVFVEIETEAGLLPLIQIHPRQDAVRVTPDTKGLAAKLGGGMSGVDAAYLAQVAHFLVGNTAALDVQGTSYSISGEGTVINSNGDWTGGRLLSESPGFSLFVGAGAGDSDDGVANYNTGVGLEALQNTAEGYLNVAIGGFCMADNIGGAQNTGVGAQALTGSNGTSNTALGQAALFSNTSGNRNTGVGRGALMTNETGNWNTAVGYNAGPVFPLAGLWNTTAIGYETLTTATNQVRIGNTNVTSIGGQVGWSVLSDGRFKQDIRESVGGLSFIQSLRPVTYSIDQKSLRNFLGYKDDTSKSSQLPARQSGFIAQEVERAAEKAGFEFSGVDAPDNVKTPYGLRYGQFVAPLVKAIQEQQEQIEELERRLNQLMGSSEDHDSRTGNQQ